MTAEELAAQIIHASGGDPKRSSEAGAIIEAWAASYPRGLCDLEIDAGAKALRERQMAGRITRAWDAVPKSEKRKWRDYAACVLTAAIRV